MKLPTIVVVDKIYIYIYKFWSEKLHVQYLDKLVKVYFWMKIVIRMSFLVLYDYFLYDLLVILDGVDPNWKFMLS